MTVTGDVLSFVRGPVTVLVNCGKKPAPLPDGEIVVSSAAAHRPPAAAELRRLGAHWLTVGWLLVHQGMQASPHFPGRFTREVRLIYIP